MIVSMFIWCQITLSFQLPLSLYLCININTVLKVARLLNVLAKTLVFYGILNNNYRYIWEAIMEQEDEEEKKVALDIQCLLVKTRHSSCNVCHRNNCISYDLYFFSRDR